MKAKTSVFFSALLMAMATGVYADTDSPINSTSTKQVAKEQLSNSGHLIDDCRAPKDKQSPELRNHCADQERLQKQNDKDQNIMQKTGQDDRVKHQDINKNSKEAANIDAKAAADDTLLKDGNSRDKISQPNQ